MFNAYKFFAELTNRNLLARQHNFVCCRVSGLDGFEDALKNQTRSTALVCVSDTSAGYTELNNTPRTRRVKTIFMAMRHKDFDMEARDKCYNIMREIFNQFMSVLIQQRMKIELEYLYLDPRVTFQEIDSYFFNGAACAHFSIAVDHYTDLSFKAEQWIDGKFPEN